MQTTSPASWSNTTTPSMPWNPLSSSPVSASPRPSSSKPFSASATPPRLPSAFLFGPATTPTPPMPTSSWSTSSAGSTSSTSRGSPRTFAILIRWYVVARLMLQAIRAFGDMETFIEREAVARDFKMLLDTLCKYGYPKLPLPVSSLLLTRLFWEVQEEIVSGSLIKMLDGGLDLLSHSRNCGKAQLVQFSCQKTPYSSLLTLSLVLVL